MIRMILLSLRSDFTHVLHQHLLGFRQRSRNCHHCAFPPQLLSRYELTVLLRECHASTAICPPVYLSTYLSLFPLMCYHCTVNLEPVSTFKPSFACSPSVTPPFLGVTAPFNLNFTDTTWYTITPSICYPNRHSYDVLRHSAREHGICYSCKFEKLMIRRIIDIQNEVKFCI